MEFKRCICKRISEVARCGDVREVREIGGERCMNHAKK